VLFLARYSMFTLSSSNRRQQGFTTYLGPLKNCCPKFLHKFVCQKQPKTVQPAQPTSQSCKNHFKQTYGTSAKFWKILNLGTIFKNSYPNFSNWLILDYFISNYPIIFLKFNYLLTMKIRLFTAADFLLLGSISSTFYVRIFRMKVLGAAFLCLEFGFDQTFIQKNVRVKCWWNWHLVGFLVSLKNFEE